ncbi:hypothetical protein [Frigoriglobus tundricola]|uniref:Uncharacterized protein n=1 Tax=Frigoriglobus tundricola TaxID=2774151 RepID=A0A6M5YT55_9BACT|nr:hypothetical protein [Frigoriglobus tundricola]QJW96503.1 hypothetical protein FTUN_4060 [Frigoriglobus tundricola]
MTAIRRPGTVSATVLFGLSLGLVAAHALAPDWSRRAGLDVWNFAALERAYEVASEERAEVYAYEERSAARRRAANQIAVRLITDPAQLPGVADELNEVFREDGGLRFVLRGLYPDVPTERHQFARHAIDRVTFILESEPARCAEVVARLEVEYQAMCVPPESPHAP